jgi:uncharacterized protein YcbK (DUF882 family)
LQLYGEMLVPVGQARGNFKLLKVVRAACCGSAAILALLVGAESVQNAAANGDTRTISFHHIHLREDTTVTYKVNGRYDQAALQKINHALRDWRTNEPTTMDPQLIDALWEVHRESGAREPIHVIGGYRAPATNAMLRRRSSGVAKFSQHMMGKAIDFYIPDVPLESIRDAGLRLQRGGIGFYPSSGAPFIHMDVGGVRHWPRLPEAQLARILSKGPITQVASNGPSTKKPSTRPAVVASRNARDEDEDAEIIRPTSRARVVASVAASVTPEQTVAAVPTPKARPTARTEPAPSGFNLASASTQPVRAPSRPAQTAEEPAPSGFNLASVSTQPVRTAPARPAQAASLVPQGTASANDIINQRSYWPNTAETPTRPVPPANIPEPPRTAAAEATITGNVARGSLAPWPMPDRGASRDTLAYAPTETSADVRSSPKARVAARPPAAPQRDAAPVANTTTVASATPDTGTAKPAARPSVKVGERINNPWMRAMIVSPSAVGFMSTSLYGAPDTAGLRPLMQKPPATVMMTFSDDPHLGMSAEEFRGNAVVFVATVTFGQRTAMLR